MPSSALRPAIPPPPFRPPSPRGVEPADDGRVRELGLATRLTIRPWPDLAVDPIGHDPRSLYVETFWLPTLGPTAVLLLRLFAIRLDGEPAGFDLDLAATSRALGVGDRLTANGPIPRTLRRLQQFDLASPQPDGAFAVRRAVPPVNRRHVQRLPPGLQEALAVWNEANGQGDARRVAGQRARRLATVLLETGDDLDTVERALAGIGFHPSICREASTWAQAALRTRGTG